MGNFFDFSLYFYYKLCHRKSTKKKPIEQMFCFIYSQQCIKTILSRKTSGSISSVFKKILQLTLPLLFKKWVGTLYPTYFVDGIRTSHVITSTITKLIDYYSQGIFSFFLFATVFN